MTPAKSDELKKQFTDWDKQLDAHWSSWRKEAEECFDIRAGRAWTSSEKTALEEANRVPVNFNRVLPLLKAVVGAEITGRLRVDYKPRTQGDSKVNEILTSGAEWARDEGDAEGEETEAFMDALTCGLGVVEMRVDFEEEIDGKICHDQCDPMEFAIDPSARKKGAVDAGYMRRKRAMSKKAARERFGKQYFSSHDDSNFTESTDDPRDAYNDDDGKRMHERDMVYVKEYQWYDVETVYMVANPATGEKTEVGDEQLKELEKAAEAMGRYFPKARVRRRKYYRAFCTGERIIDMQPLETEEFTYKFITGDYDRNEGVWFGLVRAMKDPQKWANKFYSLLVHIVGTNAKGGLLIEDDIGDADMRHIEETYADGSSVTKVPSGTISGNKVQTKDAAPIPPAIGDLMAFAVDSLPQTTGINPEMLGTVDRDQPGILEHQRKQAAFGVMASFFDSLRRYRKESGRLLLKLFRFLPPETLIRVSMDDWDNPQYVQMQDVLMNAGTHRYDVMVDDAPDGPNQKERTFAMLMQIVPLVAEFLTPDMWIEILRFSPLPESFVDKMAKRIAQAEEEGNPEEEMAQQIGVAQAQMGLQKDRMMVAREQAQIANVEADTEQKQVETHLTLVSPDPQPQVAV
ncbi:MAG: portal protein [Pseudomonadota bacterium]